FQRAIGKHFESSQFNFSPDDLAYVADHYIHLDHEQQMTASGGAAWLWHGTRLSGDLLAGSGLRASLDLPNGTSIPNGAHLPYYRQVNLGASHAFDAQGLKGLTARVDVECTIGGMVDGLNRRDPLDELGVVAVDVLDQFGLRIGRTGDQYCSGGTDCTDHVLKEGMIFGGVPAADRVGFVMNVSSGMLRMHDELVNIRRVEMKHPRFMVIDPNGSVIVVRQDDSPQRQFPREAVKATTTNSADKVCAAKRYIGSIAPFYGSRSGTHQDV